MRASKRAGLASGLSGFVTIIANVYSQRAFAHKRRNLPRRTEVVVSALCANISLAKSERKK
jgi:hypothetical protein